jgi:glycosyltransferase involved in cell wall biosynthesis
VLPSKIEGLSNIVLEAMACGTVVLARPVGGLPGAVIDDLTGYHIHSPGPEGVRIAVDRALSAGDRDPCRTRARVLIESEFSEQRVIMHYRRLFRSLGLAAGTIQ